MEKYGGPINYNAKNPRPVHRDGAEAEGKGVEKVVVKMGDQPFEVAVFSHGVRGEGAGGFRRNTVVIHIIKVEGNNLSTHYHYGRSLMDP